MVFVGVHEELGRRLMAAAYAALGRPWLAQVMWAAHHNRDRQGFSVLEAADGLDLGALRSGPPPLEEQLRALKEFLNSHARAAALPAPPGMESRPAVQTFMKLAQQRRARTAPQLPALTPARPVLSRSFMMSLKAAWHPTPLVPEDDATTEEDRTALQAGGDPGPAQEWVAVPGWRLVLPRGLRRVQHVDRSAVSLMDDNRDLTFFVERRGDGHARMRLWATLEQVASLHGVPTASGPSKARFAGEHANFLGALLAQRYWAAFSAFRFGFNYVIGLSAPASMDAEARAILEAVALTARVSVARSALRGGGA